MKYYINVSAWNLLESFVTESISPNSFYGERDFGNNLSRYINDKNDKTNYLLLTDKDLGGEYSICIDEQLLDLTCLTAGHQKSGSYLYDKTIYYKNGLVQFRFATNELKNSLISESKILYEVKCVDKYEQDFVVEDIKKTSLRLKRDSETISFEELNNVENDNRFNKLKGAIVGYVRGQLTTVDTKGQQLLSELKNLKNTFASLNTQIMTNDEYIENRTILPLIDKCMDLYLSKKSETSNSFDVLRHQYIEINKLAIMKANEIKNDNSGENGRIKKELERKKSVIVKKLDKILIDNNIKEAFDELNFIKTQEKDNGVKKGKQREYFKKGTLEYNRKMELKAKIKEFEECNNDCKMLNSELDDINEQIKNMSGGRYKFDSTLSALFFRISDILNDLIRDVSSETNNDNIDMNSIVYKNGELQIDGLSNEELIFFNVILHGIFISKHEKVISDAFIMLLIEKSANQYKTMSVIDGIQRNIILQTLREFYLYKTHKADSFSIPDNMPVFQSVMSFLVKPLGFDQIERFMLNKKFTQKCYAFMLWGACKGFADLPKTFTKILYENENATKSLDDFLFDKIISNLK
jgi:hypothetical protein